MACNNVILLVRWTQGREYVQVPSTGHEYVFVVRNNICASPVHEEDVAYLTQLRAACCGNVYSDKPRFHVASPEEVTRWSR